MPKQQPDYDVIILGAGLAGAFTAYVLAEQGYEILLIDAANEAIASASTSSSQSFKLHTGMHYAGHEATAIQCLLDTITFMRDFPEFVLDANDPEKPWRQGRHYVMSNSLFSIEDVMVIAETLRNIYAAKVAEDPANEVLGDPEQFITYLTDEEIPGYISREIPFLREGETHPSETIHPILGVQTPESQIDIVGFRKFINSYLRKAPNVHLLFNHYVNPEDVSRAGRFDLDFQVIASPTRSGKGHKVKALGNALINCTWQNIEPIDKQLGLSATSANRTVRLKSTLVVQLPPALEDMHTATFLVGPFASMTNLGDGKAVLTYEPVTNIGSYDAEQPVPSELIPYTKPLDPQKGVGLKLTQGILEGCAGYMPELSSATPIEIKVGFVKMWDCHPSDVKLWTKESLIHQRVPTGAEEKALCCFSNAALKMGRAWPNAVSIALKLAEHIAQKKITLSKRFSLLQTEQSLARLFALKTMMEKGQRFGYATSPFSVVLDETSPLAVTEESSASASYPDDLLTTESESQDADSKSHDLRKRPAPHTFFSPTPEAPKQKKSRPAPSPIPPHSPTGTRVRG